MFILHIRYKASSIFWIFQKQTTNAVCVFFIQRYSEVKKFKDPFKYLNM